MSKMYWSITEIKEFFQVTDGLITQLEKEQIVQAIRKDASEGEFFSVDDVEKLRLAKILMEEMEVNLAGVDIILRMRQNMFDMRRQFDEILEDIAGQVKNLIRTGT
jgi:MerR family transcriptional regulator/heat shock protein HspR